MGTSTMSSLIGRVRRFADILAAQTQWTSGPGEGQLPATAHTKFVICDKSIEQSFRDDKSGGFDLEHTRLQHAQRIDHLLLAIAVATLWCHELGEFVLKQGDDARRKVDPANKRTLSLFQLGLRWLKRSLATGFDILPDFQATLSNLKLQPVVIPITLNSNV